MENVYLFSFREEMILAERASFVLMYIAGAVVYWWWQARREATG